MNSVIIPKNKTFLKTLKKWQKLIFGYDPASGYFLIDLKALKKGFLKPATGRKQRNNINTWCFMSCHVNTKKELF